MPRLPAPTSSSKAIKTSSSSRLGDLMVVGWTALALPSLLLTIAAIFVVSSLARDSDLPGGTAFAWLFALALCFLSPLVLGIWRMQDLRRTVTTLIVLPMIWNLSVLSVSALLIPDLLGRTLRGSDWITQGQFGDSHRVSRSLNILGHEAADWVDPESIPRNASATLSSTSGPSKHEISTEGAVIVPIRDETAIFVDVTLAGPTGSVELPYLFDTGASYTTLSNEVAGKLGILVPEDAPTLNFNTATGPREGRVVYLPSLTLGTVKLDGLLVSVCDSCANEHAAGLLGLNVTREFLVQLDYPGNELRLFPRRRPQNDDVALVQNSPNRAYDIKPVLGMEIEGRPELWIGRVRWVVLLHNRSTAPMYGVIPKIEFDHGTTLLGTPVPQIAPGETGRSVVTGRVMEQKGKGAVEFTLTLEEAHW